MIEEFMIAANGVTAAYLAAKKFPSSLYFMGNNCPVVCILWYSRQEGILLRIPDHPIGLEKVDK